jgi:hypothetical protein
MADDDVAQLRAELAEERERRRALEARLAGPSRALEAGVPAELAAWFTTDMSTDELRAWVAKLDAHVERTNAEAVAASRPDRRRGQMLVQEAPASTSIGRRPGLNGRDR